jgi:hypothetical protein
VSSRAQRRDPGGRVAHPRRKRDTRRTNPRNAILTLNDDRPSSCSDEDDNVLERYQAVGGNTGVVDDVEKSSIEELDL